MQSANILAKTTFLNRLLLQPTMVAAASRQFSLAFNAKSRFETAYRKKMEQLEDVPKKE